jgi:hypothetical protein
VRPLAAEYESESDFPALMRSDHRRHFEVDQIEAHATLRHHALEIGTRERDIGFFLTGMSAGALSATREGRVISARGLYTHKEQDCIRSGQTVADEGVWLAAV